MSEQKSALDDVLDATGGPRIVSEEHDLQKINWQAARMDAAEMKGASGVAGALRRANLATRNGRVSVVSVGQVPWHGLGVVIDRAASVEEALKLAGLAGWDLIKVPMFAKVENGETRWVKTDKHAIVRRDTGDYLGTVGPAYKILGNEEVFGFLDQMVEGGARIETAGALGRGERAWMLALYPESIDVKGEEHKTYIAVTANHDGTASVHAFPTDVRVVCNNTFNMCERGAREGIGIRIRHVGDIASKVEAAKAALGLAHERVQVFGEQAQALAGVQIEPEEYFRGCLDDLVKVWVAGERVTQATIEGGAVLDAIMDLQETEREAQRDRLDQVLERREAVLAEIVERYESERNGGNPKIAGTAWASWNAVNEYVEHGMRYQGDARTRLERRLEAAWGGKADAAKLATFERAMGAVN